MRPMDCSVSSLAVRRSRSAMFRIVIFSALVPVFNSSWWSPIPVGVSVAAGASWQGAVESARSQPEGPVHRRSPCCSCPARSACGPVPGTVPARARTGSAKATGPPVGRGVGQSRQLLLDLFPSAPGSLLVQEAMLERLVEPGPPFVSLEQLEQFQVSHRPHEGVLHQILGPVPVVRQAQGIADQRVLVVFVELSDEIRRADCLPPSRSPLRTCARQSATSPI